MGLSSVTSPKDYYIAKQKPLDVKTMAKHVTEFAKQHSEIKKHFSITEDEFKAYQKSILDHALDQVAQAERRRESQTSDKTAKRKRRGLPPESPSQRPPRPRVSAKQRRLRALAKLKKKQP
jgi:hypothetical protein